MRTLYQTSPKPTWHVAPCSLYIIIYVSPEHAASVFRIKWHVERGSKCNVRMYGSEDPGSKTSREQLEEYFGPSVFIQPEAVVMNSLCTYTLPLHVFGTFRTLY
jgi:hypothetical protein